MNPELPTENTLYYGDNLSILREHVPDECIDLIYLDPPFNSKRTYNVLFRDESGLDSDAQIAAFDDSWHWGTTAEETYRELVTEAPDRVSTMIAALREFIGTNQMMAYLTMMAIRLVQLHRVLKPTGSLYLHCDPTASHYLKMLLDVIFGAKQFNNEVIWHYRRWPTTANRYQRMHDVLLFYGKSQENSFNVLFREPSASTKKRWGKKKQLVEFTENGSRKPTQELAQESPGVPLDDVWDIPIIAPSAKERLGYPTQKPLALLERIVEASSNPGDWVLDPFCGCGTTIAAAHKLERRWIGIDITHLSITLQRYRLLNMFPGITFRVIGEPESLASAQHLAQQNRHQFEWWALSLVHARPTGSTQGSKRGKKGADRGIDGVITFIDEVKGKPKRVLVQVKSGSVHSSYIRDLRGTVDREKAVMGVLITLEPPTRDMKTEALSAGFYASPGWKRDFPKIQILTIEELLEGSSIRMPPAFGTFKQAQVAGTVATQDPLL